MTDEKLLQKLGEDVLGWEFLETTGSLPDPSDALYQALDGKRRPVFWLCDNPSGTLQCFVAVRYRDESLGNHDRFVRLLREHASWPSGALVSAPVLRERLTTRSPLRDHLDSQLAKHSTMSPNAQPVSAFDESIAALTTLADTSELRYVTASEHYELFYKYRNFIVHEFREPGYAMGTFASGGVEPLYHGIIGETNWRLLFPVGFFHERAVAALESLVTWFTANGVDPYDRVRTSADWYDR